MENQAKNTFIGETKNKVTGKLNSERPDFLFYHPGDSLGGFISERYFKTLLSRSRSSAYILIGLFLLTTKYLFGAGIFNDNVQ